MAGIEPSGFRAKTYTEIVNEIRSEYTTREGSGRAPDWSRNKVQGIITAVIALALTDLWSALSQVYNSFRVGSAQGEQLDNLCELVGVERRGATFSTVELDLDGTAGVVVLAGSEVESQSGFRFILLEDATLPATGIVARCTTLGAVVAPANTITTIRTAVLGWTSVTNPLAAVPGQDRETDAELRESRMRRLQRGTTSTIGGIQSAVEELDFVDTALVLDNDSQLPMTLGPYTLPPHSFLTVVFPSTLTPAQEVEVATAILKTKPIGIQAFGPTTQTIPNPSGVNVTIGFAPAIAVSVDAMVTVTLEPGFTFSEVQGQILISLRTYFSTLTAGSAVRILQILRIAGQTAGVRTANVTLGRTGDPLVATDLIMSVVEYPIEGTFTVS